MRRLSCCLAFILSSDNYNVNDWVLKESLLGCILNSACAAWCTRESAKTLSQFLISNVRKKIGPCYIALSESLIIIFVSAALFTSISVSSDCKLYSPCSKSLWCHRYCCWWAPEHPPTPSNLPPLRTPRLAVSWQWCDQMLSRPLSLIPCTDQLIAKQKVLACPVECPCKCFTATLPFCQTVKWLIIKGSQKRLVGVKGEEEDEDIVAKQLSISHRWHIWHILNK